jgi:hypothetical protein
MCATGSEHLPTFYSADDSLLSQAVAYGKIRIQSAFVLSTLYCNINLLLSNDCINNDQR